MRITSTDYRKPYRPTPIKLFNAAGRALNGIGINGADLSVKTLMKMARKRTGLHDFNDPKIEERLGILVDSIESEACLHFLGRIMVRETLLGVLTNRLRMEEDFRKHPEIDNIEIQDPVFIVGLQRSGTTLLQRLLGADTATFRNLLAWEAANPAPRPDLKPRGGADPRIAMAETATKAMSYIAPDFFAVHPLEAEQSEEDCLLMNYKILSVVPEAIQRIPTFSKWLAGQDFIEAYAFHKRLLKYLTWQRPGGRWILKTPDHMLHLESLFTVYPEARVIQAHRDPLKTTASFCSMMAHAYGVFSDIIDPVEIGEHWTSKNVSMVMKSIEMKKRRPKSFIDVYYKDMMKDPIAQIRRIYDFLGIRLTDEAVKSMSSWMNSNPQNRFGKHNYDIESFGMTEDDVDRMFAEYIKANNIPLERKAPARDRTAPVMA